MGIVTYGDARNLPDGITVRDTHGATWDLRDGELSQYGRNRHVRLWEGDGPAPDTVLPHGPFRVTLDSIPDNGARALATRLMLQSAHDNLSVANGLVDYHKSRADRACAVLEIAREGFAALSSKPYVPNPAYLEALLYPSDDAVEAWIEANPTQDRRLT